MTVQSALISPEEYPAETAIVENTTLPLIVDLDGTLTPTDTLVESAVKLVKHKPLRFLRTLFCLINGKASFKDSMARRIKISAKSLPYNTHLLTYIRGEKERGRRVVLATGAHLSIAEKVSSHLGLFDAVIASDRSRNLKGVAKLEAIQEMVGNDFVYAGDDKSDIPIWRAAQAAILVGVQRSVAESVRREVPIEKEFSTDKGRIATWLRAFRVYQWLKNLLLFVPFFTSFSFMQGEKLGALVIAFFAFSFAASATYIINDLLDLESDRKHPRKRYRPFARAEISIIQGLAAAGGSFIFAFLLALAVSKDFILMLTLYIALTSAYSWVLKRYIMIDVLTLSLLYTLRILTGSVVSGIATSSWLLAFSVFIFLSLALVKRCSELVSIAHAGKEATRGRDYHYGDLAVLWPLGVGTGLSAVVVFGLFISAPETQTRYTSPNILWIIAIGMIYWLARLWIKTARGEMHDDPLIYTMRDIPSLANVIVMIAIMLLAHY